MEESHFFIFGTNDVHFQIAKFGIEMIVTGSYQSIVLPITLPTHIYQLFLPRHLIKAGETNQLIFQLGQQSNAGPAFFKSAFQECKLELPFLWRKDPGDGTGSRELCTFKHTLFFDSRLMTVSSSRLTGLRSFKLDTNPDLSRALAAASLKDFTIPSCIKITEVSHIEASNSGRVCAKLDERKVRTITGSWWVGERTGKTLARVS